MIDSGWVAAFATLISAMIITVTAVIAVRQLRHNRNANDIVVYLHMIEKLDSAEMLDGRRAIATVSKRAAEDPEYLNQLEDPTFSPEELQKLGQLLRYLEHISVLVVKGGVAESLVLAEYADNMVAMWEALRPAILHRRVAFGPHTGRAFEHLAMRAKLYIPGRGPAKTQARSNTHTGADSRRTLRDSQQVGARRRMH